MLFCFDPTHARSIGINTGVLHYMLLGLLFAAVVGLQTVGIILVVAMWSPPVPRLTCSPIVSIVTVLAVISSVLSSVLGVFISY